jgi:hypothetical protein
MKAIAGASGVMKAIAAAPQTSAVVIVKMSW